MGLPSSSLGTVQSAAPSSGFASGTEQELALTQLGAALVQQQLPTSAYGALSGAGVIAMSNAAFTNVTAIPTTAANALLYNPGTKTLVIDSVIMSNIVVDATQANAHAVFACLQRPQDTPPNASTYVNAHATFIKMDAATYQGAAQYYSGTTTTTVTVVNNGWFPLGSSQYNGAVTAGAGWMSMDADVRGRICLPPLAAMGLTEISVAVVVSSVIFAIAFHELPLAAN